jgi:hypothetical protein
METPTITTILPDSSEQHRSALRKRQADLRELLAGETWDPIMVAWRSRQLAEIAADLGVIELNAVEAGTAARR